MRNKKPTGFSLTEILIALALLGVIATFTIPKVMQNQTRQWNAAAKDTIQMIDGAYKAYQLDNAVTSSFRANNLTPYMNYLSIQTTGQIDHVILVAPSACGSTDPCLRLHNGSTLQTTNAMMMGTSTTHAVHFLLDPDGKPNGNGGESVQLFLYYNGRLTSRNHIDDPTCTQFFCPISPGSSDPGWFSWDN